MDLDCQEKQESLDNVVGMRAGLAKPVPDAPAEDSRQAYAGKHEHYLSQLLQASA
jgi:hypothetical protein